jgi:hypothetical protein
LTRELPRIGLSGVILRSANKINAFLRRITS